MHFIFSYNFKLSSKYRIWKIDFLEVSVSLFVIELFSSHSMGPILQFEINTSKIEKINTFKVFYKIQKIEVWIDERASL